MQLIHDTALGAKLLFRTESLGQADFAHSIQELVNAGANLTRLEPFYSLGDTLLLFNPAGDRLSGPEVRPQPRFVVPDDVNTTFFGSDSSEDTDRFPHFRGTSAAAPQAAGVAALMLQANARLRPIKLYQALEYTALDINDPYTSGSGVRVDYASGYSLIQADQAIARVAG